MDEYATQFASLLLSDGWVLGDLADLLVHNLLLLFAEVLGPLLEAAGLDDPHGVSPELVF